MLKSTSTKLLSIILFGLSLLMLAGLACALPITVSPEPTQPPDPTRPPDPTLALETLPPPTVQPTLPVLTLPATPDLTATRPASDSTSTPTPMDMRVDVFLIALEDGGVSGPAVGCGDSIVPVQMVVPRTEGILRAALEKLLSMRDQYFGESGLYNAMYQSNLRVDAVRIEDGKATIELSGSLLLGGVCDSPRVQAQLEQTALQFSTVTSVAVFINGVPIEEALSLRGE
jgi:hypothetical protein